jgi:cell shape-determining protein MreC
MKKERKINELKEQVREIERELQRLQVENQRIKELLNIEENEEDEEEY